MTSAGASLRVASEQSKGDRPRSEAPVDRAPLWTAHEADVVVSAATGGQNRTVEGWGIGSTTTAAVLRSPRTVLARIGLLVAVVSLVATVPRFMSIGPGGHLLASVGFAAWTVLLLAVATFGVRAQGLGRLVSCWLMGAFSVSTIVHFVAGPLIPLAGEADPDVWIVPVLEEVAKVLPAVLLLVVGRRDLRQPGLSDLLVAGFLTGAGFAFMENALWGRRMASGFDGVWGWIIPDAFALGTSDFRVGHATWTALFAVGVGLVVLHWRRPVLAVLGVVLLVVPIVDHGLGNDSGGALTTIEPLAFDGRLPAVLLLVATVAAVVVDSSVRRRRAGADHVVAPVTIRDLLDRAGAPPVAGPTEPAEKRRRADQTLAGVRYLRMRNGALYARAHDREPWPTERPARWLGALHRLGRVGGQAGVIDGRLPADRGWADAPHEPGVSRWFEPDGWTPYVVVAGSPGTSPAPGRPGAGTEPATTRPPDWARDTALIGGGVLAAAIVWLLVAPEPTDPRVLFAPRSLPGRPAGLLSLPNAPNGPDPWAWLGGIGAGGAGFGPGGPPPPDGDQPPDRPECQ